MKSQHYVCCITFDSVAAGTEERNTTIGVKNDKISRNQCVVLLRLFFPSLLFFRGLKKGNCAIYHNRRN